MIQESTNEIAPPDIEDIARLFKLIGEGVWYLQHLENTISNFTTLIILQKKREKGKNIKAGQAYRVLEKQKRLTLGVMIKNAKRENAIPKGLSKRLDHFLLERNWLIHNCIRTDYLSLRSVKKKESLFNRLSAFSKEAKDLCMEVFALHNNWFDKKGYDSKLAEKIAFENLWNVINTSNN